MAKFYRMISIVLSACLVNSTTFVAVPAFAKAPEKVRTEKNVPQDRLTEIYDVLRPVRDFETVSEMFYRAAPYIDESDRIFLGDRFGKLAMERMPTISRQGDTIVIQSKGTPDIKIQLIGTEEENEFYLNGEVVVLGENSTPLRRLQALEKILKKSDKKTGHASLFFNLFVPQAHAMEWTTMAGIGLVVLAAGYAMYKSYSDKKKAEKKAKMCSSNVPTCCVLNGAYMMHATPCCSAEIPGALSLGLGAACPTATATSGTMNTYATPTATPVTTTPITLPASTGTSGQQ